MTNVYCNWIFPIVVDWPSVVFCRFYKQLAIGVLGQCYSSDQLKATLLVVRQMTNYGRTTPLQLAVHADCKDFVAHEVCQTVLTAIWCGRIEEGYSYFRVRPSAISLFCLSLQSHTWVSDYLEFHANTEAKVVHNKNLHTRRGKIPSKQRSSVL